jgi:hypothetical protein
MAVCWRGESTSHDDDSIGRIRIGQNVITSEKDGKGGLH